MSQTVEAGAGQTASRGVTPRILGIVLFNLTVYFLIGLPLAVLPALVHFRLGYSVALAGILVSLQYVATLVTRPVVGRLSDARGPKFTVAAGLVCAVVSGGIVLLAGAAGAPLAVLGLAAFSRLWMGAAESGTGTGCIIWGIGRTGAAHTAQVISWNGVASYGGVALGAPAGVALYRFGGLEALGLATMGLALAGLLGCAVTPRVQVITGARMGFLQVLRRVWPYGMGLALGTFGFGTIVAFVTLDYASRGWSGAAYALTAFGGGFVFVRVFFSHMIGRFGGLRTALVSFLVELAGLVVLALAPSPALAVVGTVVTALGLSLIFPALAVEALKQTSVANRGAAVGVYTVFLDVALGTAGPIGGLAVNWAGYGGMYGLDVAMVAVAVGLVAWLMLKAARAKNF